MTKGITVGMGMATALATATTREALNRDIFLHPSTRPPLRLQRLRVSSRIPLHLFALLHLLAHMGWWNWNLER